MMRIALYLLTNLAVIVVASITLSLLGVNSYFAASGSGLDLTSLLIFSAVFGFAGSLISLLISKPMAKWSARVKIIEQPGNDAERWLLQTVKELSDKAGIKMPEVAIFPSGQMNAFATGASKNNALIAVSQGLLDNMSQGEIEAVVGHEMSHVANGDMVTLTLIQGVVNTFVIFFSRVIGHVVDRVILKNQRGYGIGYFITTLFAQVVLSILASIVVMYFSRKREYIADTGGADLAGHQNMINALKRLAQKEPEPLPEQLAAFGIGEKPKTGWSQLWASHPPLENRIKALEARSTQSN